MCPQQIRSNRRIVGVLLAIVVAVIAISVVALLLFLPRSPDGGWQVQVGSSYLSCSTGDAEINGSLLWVGQSDRQRSAIVTVHLWVEGIDKGVYQESAQPEQPNRFTILLSGVSDSRCSIAGGTTISFQDRVVMQIQAVQYT